MTDVTFSFVLSAGDARISRLLNLLYDGPVPADASYRPTIVVPSKDAKPKKVKAAVEEVVPGIEITKADLQAAMQETMEAVGVEVVRELLNSKFKAPRLSALDAKKYPAFLAALIAAREVQS